MTEFSGDGFFKALGWATMNSFWQVGMLWIFYLILNYFVILKAKQKYWLAVVGVLLSFAFFIVTFCLYYFKGIKPFIFFIHNYVSAGNNLYLFLLLLSSSIYLLALPLPAIKLFLSYRYTQNLKRKGLEKAPKELILFIEKLSKTLNIKKKVSIFVSTLISSPLTIGFLKPVILLPLASINNLTTVQLEAILLHELSHIRRYDYIINIIINLIRTLLYFNPFVEKFAQLAEEQREIISDELVLQFGYNSVSYATALFQMQKAIHQKGVFTLLAAGKKFLLNRVKLIIGEEKERRHQFQPRYFALIGLVLGWFLLLHLKLYEKPLPIKTDTSFAQNPITKFEINAFKKVEIQNSVSAKKNIKRGIKKKQKEFFGERETINELVLNKSIINNNIVASIDLQKVAFITTTLSTDSKQKLIKATLFKTKALLQTIEWKQLEFEIADAMNEKEIALLKSIYYKELNQIDWEQIENDLKTKYDDNALEKLNENLSQLIFSLLSAAQSNNLNNNYKPSNVETNAFSMNAKDSTLQIPFYLILSIEKEDPFLKLHLHLDSLHSNQNESIIRL